MIFMRETIGVPELERRRHHRLQHAVDAEPDAQVLLVRLDVDVAGAPLNRREHQRVDQPDDRRLAALPLERRRVDLLGAVDDLEVLVAAVSEVLERLVDEVGRLGAVDRGLRRRALPK